MEINLRALNRRGPNSEALRRYQHVAQLLTENPAAQPRDGVEWVRRLITDLRIPPLRTYGITREHVAELCEHALKSSSMKANPVALEPQELAEALEKAL